MRKLNYHKSDRVTELERFWAKVDKTTPDECWEWLAFKDKFGYGHFRMEGRMIRAHRYSLQIKVGRVLLPEECACHTCNNTSCVNPGHLYVGTQEDNMKDLSNSKVVRGQNHSRAKVLDVEVEEMILLREKGILLKEIAKLYQISGSQCSRLTRNKQKRCEA